MLYRSNDTRSHTARIRNSTRQVSVPDLAQLRASLEFSRVVAPVIERDRLKPQLERAVFGFGLVNPLLSLPQLYNVLVLKHVAGLSAITLASALIMSVLWMLYGILGRQTVVWATSAVWVVLNGITLVGVTVLSH